MAQDLNDKTLGDKHRDYNKSLGDLIVSKQPIQELKADGTDITNLLKIDLACHNKDVDYILNTFKSEDMLYVSRALTKNTWLITEQQYANIINPDYLQSEIFPNMKTKAITKLKKHIRHHIKDEKRAELFYKTEQCTEDAIKWLPHCSVTFINEHIETHLKVPRGIKLRMFKRLSEKSVTIFQNILKHAEHYERIRYLQIATFLLKTNPGEYLDALEDDQHSYRYFKFNQHVTQIIMKHDRNRIFDKIDKYLSLIHIPTFVKYFKVDEIKPFLYAQVKKTVESEDCHRLKAIFKYDTLKYFIQRLPKEEQFPFVKKVCMGKVNETESTSGTDLTNKMRELCISWDNRNCWYRFAPFELAFEEITELISQATSTTEKYTMLYLLIQCANNNLEHIQSILKYFINNQENYESHDKLQFVSALFKHTDTWKYDAKTWTILNGLLPSINENDESMSVFSDNNEILHGIIIYNILNEKNTHEVLEKQFSFHTLKSHRNKLNPDQQNKLYTWLYEHALSKVKDDLTDEKAFTETVDALLNVLNLFKDWDKSLLDYPSILYKIKELIHLRNKNSWKKSLSSLYNVNKSWRKHMFEDSIALHPSEEVCLNALKHEPQLLTRHKDEVDALKIDDKLSLRRLLGKLRIYWPQSLGQQWTDEYLYKIEEVKSQKAVIRNLCLILDQKPLQGVIEKYKPNNSKIDWKTTDERILNVQRFLAKNMHLGRPQPSPDAILLYAKGDYLQFALPSLSAIFYNLKASINHEYILKLIDAPVSLQKHGIRLAFRKLDLKQLKEISLKCWQKTKNVSIRAVVFQHFFKILCNEKDNENVISLWKLLEQFIDSLTFAENKDIYELLKDVKKVPLNVRADFLVKSYNFFERLIPNIKENDRPRYENIRSELANQTRGLMHLICPNFVEAIIQEYLDTTFFSYENNADKINSNHGIIKVISAYVLCASNENEQIEKYEKILVPLMQRSFSNWGKKQDGQYIVRKRLQILLNCLSQDLKDYVLKTSSTSMLPNTDKKMIIPLKMYSLIQIKLENTLPIQENYVMLTKWKLTVAVTKLTLQYASPKKVSVEQFGQDLGKTCLEYLKTDVNSHFPCIYVLFLPCVKQLLQHITYDWSIVSFCEALLSDKEFIQGYLTSIEIIQFYSLPSKEDYEKIREQIGSHPSIEVKMHYYNKMEKNMLY